MGVNLLFLIFACVLCALGSYALNNQVAVLSGQTLPQGIVVIGAFLLILSLVGYVSAWKEIRIGLGIYFFFICILTIILFSVGIAVYVKKNEADVYITEAWVESSDDTRQSLQNAFWCCDLVQFNETCQTEQAPAGQPCLSPCDMPANAPDAPVSTCLPLMTSSFTNNFQTAGACGIAFSIIMVVCLLFTAYLMVGIRQSAVNAAIERNRERNERDMQKRRKGKGIKMPQQIGQDVL